MGTSVIPSPVVAPEVGNVDVTPPNAPVPTLVVAVAAEGTDEVACVEVAVPVDAVEVVVVETVLVAVVEVDVVTVVSVEVVVCAEANPTPTTNTETNARVLTMLCVFMIANVR